jgi:hypothetical protein
VPVVMMHLRIPTPRYKITMNAHNLEMATVGTAEFTSAHETELMSQRRKSPRIVSAIHMVVSGLTDIDRHPDWMETAWHASMTPPSADMGYRMSRRFEGMDEATQRIASDLGDEERVARLCLTLNKPGVGL